MQIVDFGWTVRSNGSRNRQDGVEMGRESSGEIRWQKYARTLHGEAAGEEEEML